MRPQGPGRRLDPVPNDGWPTAEAFLPERLNLTALKRAAAGCRGCPAAVLS